MKTNIDTTLQKLADIAAWFEGQDEIHVEQGLEKVKEASILIKASKERLLEIENEFEEIKKELDPSIQDLVTDVTAPENAPEQKEASSDIPF